MLELVRIFHSFEEADAADALSRREVSPQERVDVFFAIRERAHPDAAEQEFARVCRVLDRPPAPNEIEAMGFSMADRRGMKIHFFGLRRSSEFPAKM
jgi:hypothetical protein